ncbi:MAG: ABC transporter ATP-binding protein/permease [Lachnospiraceae bacterium]|nr:ABC transporter ATP-binding protein/permease [Lachnospiraceae bacterium]
MRSILVYMKKYRKEAILAPLFKLLEASFELMVPLVIAAIIDVGISGGDKSYIMKMCAILVAFAAVGLVFSLTAQFFAAKAATGYATTLRHEMFKKIQSMTFSQIDLYGTDTLITRMTSDINQVQSGVNLFLRLLLRSPFVVAGAMIMAFYVDSKSAVIFAIVIPILAVVIMAIMLVTIPLYTKLQEKLDVMVTNTRENLTGAKVIRAFNKEKDEQLKFYENNKALDKMQQFTGSISGIMNPLTFVILNGATVILIYKGALRVETGDLTKGQMISLLNYMSQILVELVKLANLIIQVTKAVACGKRVAGIIEIEPDMEDGYKDYPEGDMAVVFNHVSFAYKGSKENALEDITFEVKKGSTVGIIGGTGSGKSSLVNLLPRFYDVTEGSISIYGENIKNIKLDELRKNIGIALQKSEVFKGTIKDNLKWGDNNASDDAIWEALEVSQAKEFVIGKKGDINFNIEQNGRNLSGGQKQRLNIARAIINKPDILILDDSASALDFATDAKLRMALNKMNKDMTKFIVSQRSASVQHADMILVLDNGRLVGKGTHEELLESNEVYQEIYYSQFPKEDNEMLGGVNYAN